MHSGSGSYKGKIHDSFIKKSIQLKKYDHVVFFKNSNYITLTTKTSQAFFFLQVDCIFTHNARRATFDGF